MDSADDIADFLDDAASPKDAPDACTDCGPGHPLETCPKATKETHREHSKEPVRLTAHYFFQTIHFIIFVIYVHV